MRDSGSSVSSTSTACGSRPRSRSRSRCDMTSCCCSGGGGSGAVPSKAPPMPPVPARPLYDGRAEPARLPAPPACDLRGCGTPAASSTSLICTMAAMGSFMRHVAQPVGPSAVRASR